MQNTNNLRPVLLFFLVFLQMLPAARAQFETVTDKVVARGHISEAEFRQVLYDLKTVSLRTGYSYIALIGLVIHETGYFSSKISREGYNICGLTGLRAEWKGKPVIRQQHLVRDNETGKSYMTTVPFRSYESYSECIFDFADFLTHPRYIPLQNTHGARDFLQTLGACGYYQDRSYTNKVMQILVDTNLMPAEAPVYSR